MIPESLVIEGLYSYQKRTTIDFTALTAARLFGIFGPVGSGKSTLIEAMSIAVYGDTTRLNARGDNRVYNLLNLRSDRLWIDFVFSVGDRRYRFTAEAKRRSTDFETVGSLERTGYRWTGDEWLPLESVSGASILGMSYDNFRRTVIIPQGHFQEFLQLKPAERTKMLKELFSLDRFDLYRNAKTLFDAARNRVETIEALLAELPDNLGSALEEIGERIAANERRRASLLAARDDAVMRRDRIQAVVELYREKNVLERRLATLNTRRDDFDSQREYLRRLEAVRDHLLSPYQEAARSKTALQEGMDRKAEVEGEIEPVRQARQETGERLNVLVHRQEERPGLEARRAGLVVYREIASITAEREAIDTTLAEWEGDSSEIKANLQTVNEELDALAGHRDAVLADLPSTDEIRRYEQRLQRQKRLQEAHDLLDEITTRVTVVEREWNVSPGDLEEPTAAPQRAVRLVARIDALQERVSTFLASQEHRAHLSELSAALKSGEPCPLCGATEHPAPFDGIATTKSSLEHPTAANLRGELERHRARSEVVVDGFSEEDERVAAVDVTEETISRWWGDHDRVSRFNEQIVAAQRKREALQQRVGEVSTRRAEVEGRRSELSRRIDTLREQIPDGFAAPSTPDAIDEEITSIDRSLETIRTELETVQSRYDELAREEARLTAIVTERTQTVTRAAALRDQAIEELHLALTSEPITAMPGVTEDTLPELVSELPTIPNVRQRIETFDHEYRDVQNELARVIEQITAKSQGDALGVTERGTTGSDALGTNALGEYDADAPDTDPLGEIDADAGPAAETDPPTETGLATDAGSPAEMDPATEAVTAAAGGSIEDLLANAVAEVGTIEGTIQRNDNETGELRNRRAKAESDLSRQEELIEEKKTLITRRDNLATLVRLLEGSKFVRYVSQVFLEQLVAAANSRFRRLTRNRLELSLRDDQEFEVIDYLNGGRRRNVKTLSGGQTFQAALCLALALVDSVDRTAGGSSPGFFFLDEGFGSLDEDSLRDVFVTLDDLRREDRIVGIISHVESLKEEIDTYLQVYADEERGSMIR